MTNPTSPRLTYETLFRKHFAPLYPDASPEALQRLRTTDANPGKNPNILAQVDQAADVFAELAPEELDLDRAELDFSDASVHRIAERLTRERRAGWLERTTDDGIPLLIPIALHGTLYVATCARRRGGEILIRNPHWESLVRITSPLGTADLAIFHWWLKALSDDEIGRPKLSDRYRKHVEIPLFDSAALPIIAPPDRALPRLRKVRYDNLHKYLKAHLPELKDLGADFPSPERFSEMGFVWLDFVLLGGGRMVLMHGPTKTGIQLLWLTKQGFRASAYFAAESIPEHRVELDGELMRVRLPVGSKMVDYEMLWWGS